MPTNTGKHDPNDNNNNSDSDSDNNSDSDSDSDNKKITEQRREWSKDKGTAATAATTAATTATAATAATTATAALTDTGSCKDFSFTLGLVASRILLGLM